MTWILLVAHTLAGTHTDSVGDGGATLSLDNRWAANFFTPRVDVYLEEVEATFKDADSGCDGSECTIHFYLWTDTGTGTYTGTSLGSTYANHDSYSDWEGVTVSHRLLRAGTTYGIGVLTAWDIETTYNTTHAPTDPSWGTGLGYAKDYYGTSTDITPSIVATGGIRMNITVTANDGDGDGYDGAEDCDDTDRSVHPGAADTWYDGEDTDCGGNDDYDRDGDGAASDAHGGDDCDDLDAAVHPGAPETWYDGTDQDCSGGSDDDQDGDGDDAANRGGGDCDDLDPAFHSDAEETWYDGVDQDCSGTSDYDQDGDGHDAPSVGGDDCDDTDPTRALDCSEDTDTDADTGGGGGADTGDGADDGGEDDEAKGGSLCATGATAPFAWGALAGVLALIRARRRA